MSMLQSNVDYTTLHQSHEVLLRVELLVQRLSELNPGRNAAVCEIGLGSGDTTRMLAEHFDDLYCVDCDEQRINDVRAYIAPQKAQVGRLHFICGDAADVTFDWGDRWGFDHVFLIGLLEHCADGEAVLRNVKRALNPGGRIHILVNNAGSIHRHLGVAIGDIADVTELSRADLRFGHYRVYTPDSLYTEVLRAGLVLDHIDLHYLKPLPSSMMDTLPLHLSRAFVGLGRKFPHLAAYSYVEAVLP